MNGLKKYWKVILGALLLLAAVPVFFLDYLPGKQDFERRQRQAAQELTLLQTTIDQNAYYSSVQDRLPAAGEELSASRADLYSHFPVELREEDLLLYLLALEGEFSGVDTGELGFDLDLYQYFQEKYGLTISFSFGSTEAIAQLSDGAVLAAQVITVYYTGPYENVKRMMTFLASDSRITSIQYGTMAWSGESLTGTFTLRCYVLADGREYTPPEVDAPETGKTNVFQ